MKTSREAPPGDATKTKTRKLLRMDADLGLAVCQGSFRGGTQKSRQNAYGNGVPIVKVSEERRGTVL